MAKIIAICNQKGGTGKTTTAISLATALALAGKKVLIIDIDPQGNSTSGLGIDKRRLRGSLYHALLEHLPSETILIDSGIGNLVVAPSDLDLSGLEVELVSVDNREFRLQSCLEPLRDKFEFIFIDSPPSLGLLTINALTAADSVIIPIQCEYYALEGVTLILKTINLVKERLNPRLQIEGVVLTMADFRTNLTNEVISEIKSFFKERVYKTIIPRNIRLSEAPGFGKPIFLYDKNSIGAKKYQDLANELMGLPTVTTEQDEQEQLVKGGQMKTQLTESKTT